MTKLISVLRVITISSFIAIPASNYAYADNLTMLFNKAKTFSPHLTLAKSQQEIAKQKINQAKSANEPKINFNAQEKKGVSARNAGDAIDYRLRNYAIQMSLPIINQAIQEEISSAKISDRLR